MTTKRFTIVDEQFISYYGGTGHLISNGECEIWLWHSKEESQKVCNKLNSILDENEYLNKSRDELISENRHIKKTIQTMLINERTAIGKSVLKQLWNAIHME